MNQSLRVRKMAQLSMLLALAIVFQIIEGMIPLPFLLPGIKFGFANVVGLITLTYFGQKEMLAVNLSRVIFAAIFRTGFGLNFMLAFNGALFASFAMILFYQFRKLSMIGISIVGATFHVVGQMLVIIVVYDTIGFLFTYLPVLLVVSIFTGIFTGYIASLVLDKTKRFKLNPNEFER